MSRRIIGIDVDLTVCPSDQGWINWLNERSSKYDPSMWLEFKSSTIKLPYNLGSMFAEEIEDPMEYWRELDYTRLKPIKGCVEKLKELSTYFDIVFISAIKGQHTKSKYYWLEQHFPFNKGYIATKEKFLMNNSVCAMIDDRLDNLQGFDQHKRVLYKTPYTQSDSCGVGYVVYDWESFSVRDFCDQYLN